MADAACIEYPTVDCIPADEKRSVEAVEAARAVCTGCLCRADCLGFALSQPMLVGVWGGTTTAQRKALRREAAA